MKTLQLTFLLVAIAFVADIAFTSTDQAQFQSPLMAEPNVTGDTDHTGALPDPDSPDHSAVRAALSEPEPLLLNQEIAALDPLEKEPALEKAPALDKEPALEKELSKVSAKMEVSRPVVRDRSRNQGVPKSYLPYYVYAEVVPEKPADIVLDRLKNIPVGTPVEEIRRASEAFGVNFNFMKAVAKVESDFRPKQRTGRYIGLFQLSNYEFNRYGSGEITNPRDNAVAAAYKFVTEGTMFEWNTRKKPTFSDLYLIHQQGWQGAAEHVSHPERIAWKSMCATEEGQERGEKWCKRAIWQNTLPVIKHVWKSVNNLTSRAFVAMWRQRIEGLYARYSDATAGR